MIVINLDHKLRKKALLLAGLCAAGGIGAAVLALLAILHQNVPLFVINAILFFILSTLAGVNFDTARLP